MQSCVLKMNINCDGCKQKVKKVLQKIEGVYETKFDLEKGKVTVLGNVDPDALIYQLGKSGKRAELLEIQKSSNSNQLMNMQMGNGKNGGKDNSKAQKSVKDLPKGGQQQIPQQLQQFKIFKDNSRSKDTTLPFKQVEKTVQFSLPKEEDSSDDDDDDDVSDDEDFGHSHNQPSPNKMKPMMGNENRGNEMSNAKMKMISMNNGRSSDGRNGANGGKRGDGEGKNEKDGGGFPLNGKTCGGRGNTTPGLNNGGGGSRINNNEKGGGGGGQKNMGLNVMNNVPRAGLGGTGGDVGRMGNQMGQTGQILLVQVLQAMNPSDGRYYQGLGRPHQQPYMAPSALDTYTYYFSDENTNGCSIM